MGDLPGRQRVLPTPGVGYDRLMSPLGLYVPPLQVTMVAAKIQELLWSRQWQPMHLLPVSHIRQRQTADCLAACAWIQYPHDYAND
jgi:hypothetical protein